MKPFSYYSNILFILLSISCSKEDSICKTRYSYFDSEKHYQTEIYEKGTISFYDTLLYDSIVKLLKDFNNISFTNLDNSIRTSYIIIDINSKSCSETDALFKRIKQKDKISNCNKWFFTEVDNQCGMYDIFLCKLKHDTLKNKMLDLISYTKTFLVRQSIDGGYYLIRADKNSNGDALDMANYFYESGYFEWSEPDYIGGFSPNK